MIDKIAHDYDHMALAPDIVDKLNEVIDVVNKATEAEENDILEDQEFYELMQAYRHIPISEQKETVEAFEAVKNFIRKHFIQL